MSRRDEPPTREAEDLDGQRDELLARVASALELPMAALGLVWLVLVVVEMTRGLGPFLTTLSYVIWATFLLQFALELTLAPRKREYLRRNWLTALALALPALRVARLVRLLRVVRAARGARLVRVVTSVNRGMRVLGRVMGRRHLGYVLAITLLVNLIGAAGVFAFEREVPAGPITSYGAALWWTAMTLTTMGSDYFPRSAEGRLLGLLLAVYGFAVFGYVTASIASLFVARDAETEEGEHAGAAQVEALRGDVATLTRRIDALLAARSGTADPGGRDGTG